MLREGLPKFPLVLLLPFIRMEVNDTILLGAPLFPGPALDREWDRRLDDLARAVDRLGVISSQDALILLRSSFSAPKVLHLLRCSPSARAGLTSMPIMPWHGAPRFRGAPLGGTNFYFLIFKFQ